MTPFSIRCIRLAATAVGGFMLLVGPTTAQIGPAAPSATDPDRNSPPYTKSVDAHMTVRSDLTATTDSTTRFKILRQSAIQSVSEQSLSYVESINPFEIIEAYTEKPDGKKIPVDAAHILTRDAATGLNAVYERDAKVKTLIFPDVEVGDSLVYVTETNRIDHRFPGHFSFATVLPRSIPYDTFRLTVDEPKLLGLRIHVRGEGLAHEIIEESEARHHLISYRARGWAPEEPDAVSSLDRDPQLVITTFRDMAELGASYWSSMKDEDAVAPEIQALADEITKGIEDKRAQAVAIDLWVKKNIRYVLVFLGSGGITPNPPLTVLNNKFGDCKDHVALMGALLKAKAIASEQALVNVGNRYGLPELPAPFFNHVILYLPQFDVYTDPTASYASFGVLAEGTYDKPVLHISSAGGRLARTPPMRPEDHVTTAKTRAWIGADGAIKGTTQQIAMGIFATGARQMAARIETQGREKSAEATLRTFGYPGKGVFAPAAPFDFSEPYSIQGDFELSEKLPMPLKGVRNIPIGMPIHRRPGLALLGPRVPGRMTDFVCFAGRQVEEIELTFADGLPLPGPIRGTTIDNKYFSYQASYTAKGRTLAIRREFTSKVPSQVCAKEVESELSEPMQQVVRSLNAQMTFRAAAAH